MSITLPEAQLEISWTPLLPSRTARQGEGYGTGGYGLGLYGASFTTVTIGTGWTVETTA